MAFGKKNTATPDETIYKVTYQGGLPELPKGKLGEIQLVVTDDAFLFRPTVGSQKFWAELTVPFANVSSVDIVARTVSTMEGLLGGVNASQLQQDNNLNFTYATDAGQQIVLRVEMLTGFSVMGQAGKCREFMDYLRTKGILDRFRSAVQPSPASPSGVDEVARLAELHAQGILTDDEFTAAKRKALGL